MIIVSSAHLDTDKLFSAIFAAAFAGIGLFQILGWIEKRAVSWNRADME